MNDSDPLADSLLVHASFVQRLAHGLAGPDADDLAQDTWSAALQHRGGGVRDVRAWLATIAANLWRNTARGAVRRTNRERAAAPGAAEPSVADIVAREEVRRRVVDAVLALPGNLRPVVLLRYYEGLDAGAIARRHCVPHSTVRSQLRDALALLRQRLDREHGDSRAAWLAPLATWRPDAAITPVALALRVVWPLRVALGVAAIALLALLLAPMWSDPPPALPPTGAVPVARNDETSRSEPTASNERAAAVAGTTAPADARGPEDLWGRVTAAEDGRAVAGAEIDLVHQPYDEVSETLASGAREAPVVIATARSGDDGAFAFRVQRGVQHRLAVRAAGFAAARVRACTGGSETNVPLARAATIEGTVVRADGTPLHDVLVEAFERGDDDRSFATRTANDGSFALCDLGPGIFVVRARPTCPATTTVLVQAGERQRVELTAPHGRAVRGVVRDAATNAPIGGARVATSPSRTAAESAADGSFAVDEVDEQAELRVTADGYVTHVLRAASANAAALDVRLRRGVAIAGRIVGSDGTPRAGAIVAVSRTRTPMGGSSITQSTRADAAGRFRVDALEDTKGALATLLAHADGCATRVVIVPAERLDAAPLLDLGDVTLPPPGLLEGRVADTRGRAIAGAQVRVEPTLAPGIHQPLAGRTTRTAADGMFRFASLDAGRWSLSVVPDDTMFPEDGGAHDVVAGVVRRADVTIDLGLAITGRLVVRANTEAPPRHCVSIYATGATRMRQAVLADDGTFRIDRLAKGAYLLFSVDTPKGLALVPVANVAAGSTDVLLELVPAESIEGRVLDRDGKPVADVQVTFWPPNVSAAHSCTTDRDGRFRLAAPPGVAGKLRAQAPDNLFRQVGADVTAGARDVELRLP